jgi:hypothetical protein
MSSSSPLQMVGGASVVQLSGVAGDGDGGSMAGDGEGGAAAGDGDGGGVAWGRGSSPHHCLATAPAPSLWARPDRTR